MWLVVTLPPSSLLLLSPGHGQRIEESTAAVCATTYIRTWHLRTSGSKPPKNKGFTSADMPGLFPPYITQNKGGWFSTEKRKRNRSFGRNQSETPTTSCGFGACCLTLDFAGDLALSHRQGCLPSHFFFRRPQASQLLRMPYRFGFSRRPVRLALDAVVPSRAAFVLPFMSLVGTERQTSRKCLLDWNRFTASKASVKGNGGARSKSSHG